MKRDRKEKIKHRFYLLVYMLVLFMVFSMAWGIQVRMQQKREMKNINMVYQMVGELQKGVSYKQIAADMMKGNIDQDAIKEGFLVLEEYGYDEDYYSIFIDRTKKYTKKLAMFYLVLYLFFLILFYSIYKIVKKNRERELRELEKILEQFYDGKYDSITEDFREETEDYIYMRLESLGQKIALNEQRIEREKEDTKALVSDLSHQLKTPVASIKMCFQLLEDNAFTSEEKKEFLSRLGEQITHLEGMVAALVNISRMEKGMIEIHKEMANIFDTLVQAVNQVYVKAEEKGIEIVVDSQEAEIQNISLPHDVKWTKEAIVNVLENAVKYSPTGSCIWIKMNIQIHFLRIEIKDEGIGIKKEEINRIFQRFYRGKNEVVKQAEGSGIGLYLTRKILEEQGGNIVVVIPIGKGETKGSTFAIMLPLK